ncbi:MAG: ABC transporter substrate-binding protein [Eubacterium sp.]|jgi:ABC-type nitrate/sulfonate/bicarbonate transport systems, periplasmic components|nr:ABC transporter substrate-binding protein [Eubacterium sp.]
MKKKKLIAITLFVLLLSTTLLFGCTPDKEEKKETAPEPEKKAAQEVTLNEVAHSIFYAPMYVAIENGYFKEEGLDISLVTGYGADKTMTAVLSGEADIGFMGPETTVYTYNEGANDLVVNFAQLTQRAGNFIVAREAVEDFKWEQLKDSYVYGGRAGGMPQMVFEYVLKKNNINPAADLTIDQSIDFGSTAAAFSSSEEADYTVEFEPGATMLEQQKSGYVVASLGVESGYVPYTAFSAKESFIEENPEVIQSFTNALQKGMDYVNEHSAEEIAAVIAPQFPETDDETISTIVERYAKQDTWNTDLVFTEESYDLLLDILSEAGELSDSPEYEKLVNTEFATTAK